MTSASPANAAARPESLGSKAVGLVAASSLEFVEESFRAYARGLVAVSLRSPSDEERRGLVGGRILEIGDTAGWGRARFTPLAGDEPAQVAFTSGTTGAAKAIVLTRGNIADAIGRLNAAMEVDENIREYVGVPVHYSFGLGRCRAVAAAGGEYYLPPRGFDPVEIVTLLKAGRINALSAVPTLWRLLLQNADLIGTHGRQVKWIEIGSQPMSRAEKEGLKALFPRAAIVQHYGLTEASRTTFLRIDQAEGEALDSVGSPTGKVELKLDGEGRVMIRGPHVAPWTLEAGALVGLPDADGWLATNDLGEMRDGRLHFRGRADDLINCGGVKLSPDALEARLHALLSTSQGVAVCRLPDPLRGEGVLVSFTRQGALDVKTVAEAAAVAAEALGVPAAAAIKVQQVEALPTTETGKLRRQALVDRYLAEKPGAAAAPDGSLASTLLRLWRETLGVDRIGEDDDFFTLGGDAHSANALIPRMEAAGLPPEVARRVFDGATVAELAAAVAQPATPAAAAEPDLEAQLLAIWREALGRDDVTAHQGFYDVGGDSLSAVTVALGMERAGFAPELAHGIFDGRTIAELCREAGAGTPAPAPAASDDVEARLLAIWREALGRDDVTVDQGFYDVGGDSLSAVTVALGMERAGFAPELAHGIFDGKTIAELCREAGAKAPAPAADWAAAPAEAPAPPARAKSEIALLSEASNFIKGVVFLCMISSHWIPVYLAEIGKRDGLLGKALAPIFSLGSPTLAFAFGMGVAVFHLRQLESSPAAFKRNIRMSVLLLGGGVVVGGLSETLSMAVREGFVLQEVLLRTFADGPFMYYLLAAASLPLWLRFLKRDGRSAAGVFLAALGCYAAYLLLQPLLPLDAPDRLASGLARLLVGHWSLFQMAAISLMGVGAGLAIEARLRSGGRLDGVFPIGLLMAAGGLVMSAAAGIFDSWFVFPKLITLPGIFFYGGVAVMLIAKFEALTAAAGRTPLLRRPIELVCCLGILLFPLYVAQSLVYHSASTLDRLTSLSLPASLTAVIALYWALVFLPIRKVFRLYYAGRR